MKQILSDFVRMIFGIDPDQEVTTKEMTITLLGVLFIIIFLVMASE